MEFSLQLDSCIRGHHVYKTIWTPSLGESLSLKSESGNSHDRFAISVLKDEHIVGHVPREVSQFFFYFMQHNGTITVKVTGHRRYGRGLEVPCVYTLTVKPKHIRKAKKLLLPS